MKSDLEKRINPILDEMDKNVANLIQQKRELRNRLLEAYGMASSFDMLNEHAGNSQKEIMAAKETGASLAKFLNEIIKEHF